MRCCKNSIGKCSRQRFGFRIYGNRYSRQKKPLLRHKQTLRSVRMNSSTTNSLTVDLLTWEGMKNGRLELTYPEELTLVSARSTLDAGAGITDLDASKPGTVHFAWAAYTAQKDGTPVLRLTFRGQHGKTYFWNVIDTETGWQSKSMLPFDYRFNDVLDENAWYYDAVYAAWDAGLMNGVGRDYFAPNATLDRATLATVLYREAGEPAAKGTASFTDIAEGQWYTDAVNWAAEQGVVNGYPDGTFRPEAPITRQEMATMLYRYWKLQGGKYTAKDDVLAGYQDCGEVADWALEAMSWTVQSGIIVGMTPTTLNPADGATRAQVALVLVNYLKMN